MAASKLLRNTRQRKVILEELAKLTSHPTADELYEIVRKRLPRISLGTIYRNLELLTDNGQVMKLDQAGGRARFDGKSENHYHARCVRCGKVLDVSAEPIKAIERAAGKISDFNVTGHRLEFVGICSGCNGKA